MWIAPLGEGQRALESQQRGSKMARTKRKRRSRKVAGSA
jgi:hypothetical protein